MTAAAKVYHRGLATTPTSRDDWQSPACVLERVRAIDTIKLDPCTSRENPVGAARFLTPAEDGLASPWADQGLVFANFPYSQAKAWAAAIVANARMGCEIVTLCPARTDTKWFFLAGWCSAQAICFWRGRLRFVGAESCAPFPSAVLYHGDRPWAFEQAFHDAGKVVRING